LDKFSPLGRHAGRQAPRPKLPLSVQDLGPPVSKRTQPSGKRRQTAQTASGIFLAWPERLAGQVSRAEAPEENEILKQVSCFDEMTLPDGAARLLYRKIAHWLADARPIF